MMRQTLALVLSVFVFAGCTTNPSTGRSQLILVSADQVSALGEEAKPDLIREYGGEVKSPQLRQYVSRVGKDLARHVEPEYEGINWEFITLDSDVINAFALPGGKVFITRGLLSKFNNEAQVAGVLGHEIGHVTGRHVDERISQASALQLGTQLAGAVVGQSESGAAQLVPLVVGLGGQGYLLKFGRDQESEADRQGLKYMTAAGYNPQGMMQVLRVLIEADQGGRPPELLATHPNPERRLSNVRGLIQDDYSNTLSNPNYQLYRDRFQRDAVPHLGAAATPKSANPSAMAHHHCGVCGLSLASMR